MADLMARTAFHGLLPLTIGTVTATEISFDAITSIAPLAGQRSAVSEALIDQVGVGFPDPGCGMTRDDVRVIWTGYGQAFVLGPTLDPIPGAATTDQSDAWGAVALEGAEARAVLARLIPIDLRPGVFAEGHVARTMLGHMNAVILRTGTERYELLVFRSMAGTAVHDLRRAMNGVAARAALN